jgi:hypothetical protein
VTKWVAYDLLLPSDVGDEVPFLVALKYGALSGIAGNAIFELLNKLESNRDDETSLSLMAGGGMSAASPNVKVWGALLTRFLRAGLEGGALFASYEGTINFFESKTVPPEVKNFFQTKFTDILPPQDLRSIFEE